MFFMGICFFDRPAGQRINGMVNIFQEDAHAAENQLHIFLTPIEQVNRMRRKDGKSVNRGITGRNFCIIY
ncbi:hypothetical protein GCM10023187_30860 [Nibrella viscosa]|uniref:Uncharacterized protein n=1 Tax=Nibrella viscosa TaxID=1084524 RepID=A0ABP8KKI6_9BACT